MKTSELQGVQLDYWVARAEGKIVEIIYGHCVHPVARYHDEIQYEMYKPSFDWAVGGPILERMMLGGWGIWRYSDDDEFTCSNTNTEALPFKHGNYDDEWISMEGPTILIAAMRAYVTSKFGDEVPDA